MTALLCFVSGFALGVLTMGIFAAGPRQLTRAKLRLIQAALSI